MERKFDEKLSKLQNLLTQSNAESTKLKNIVNRQEVDIKRLQQSLVSSSKLKDFKDDYRFDHEQRNTNGQGKIQNGRDGNDGSNAIPNQIASRGGSPRAVTSARDSGNNSAYGNRGNADTSNASAGSVSRGSSSKGSRKAAVEEVVKDKVWDIDGVPDQGNTEANRRQNRDAQDQDQDQGQRQRQDQDQGQGQGQRQGQRQGQSQQGNKQRTNEIANNAVNNENATNSYNADSISNAVRTVTNSNVIQNGGTSSKTLHTDNNSNNGFDDGYKAGFAAGSATNSVSEAYESYPIDGSVEGSHQTEHGGNSYRNGTSASPRDVGSFGDSVRDEEYEEMDSLDPRRIAGVGDIDLLSCTSSYDGGVATQAAVKELRSELLRRVQQLEDQNQSGRVSTFMYMFEEFQGIFDQVRAQVDSLVKQNGGNHICRLIETNKLKEIGAVKAVWSRLADELNFSLQNLAANPEEPFFVKVAELNDLILRSLSVLHVSADSALGTAMERVFPVLQSMYLDSLDLIQMDDAARQCDPAEYSLDDLRCKDSKLSMKNLVLEAALASIPVLDESVAKIGMLHRLNKLEEEMDHRVSREQMDGLCEEMGSIKRGKVEREEFLQVSGKLASIAEFKTLREFVLNSASKGGGVSNNNDFLNFESKEKEIKAGKESSPLDSARSNGVALAPGGEVDDGLKDIGEGLGDEEAKSLVNRFEMLSRQQQDLFSHCERFVPREEVHDAMKALVAEVKQLKRNTIKEPVVKEWLRNKADADDVRKLVDQITLTFGNLNLNYGDKPATNVDESGAAAVHARCLLCDKPAHINMVKKGVLVKGLQQEIKNSRSQPLKQDWDEMTETDTPSRMRGGARPSTGDVPGRQRPYSPNSIRKEKAVQDLAVIRSTIDSLPNINGNPQTYIGGPITSAQGNVQEPQYHITGAGSMGMQLDMGSASLNSGSAPQHYKQRIRSSGGGGLYHGPNHKAIDTR